MEEGAARVQGKATIRDVARRAGVSIATVSRYLNRSGPVEEASRIVAMSFCEPRS